MEEFIVNSAILPTSMDPVACATGVPKMLKQKGIQNVKVKRCYCCGSERTVVFIAEAQSRESLLDALAKIDLPVASVAEAKEVAPK